ncbi:L-arabinose ABC transporter ATP-binding protein AraG [Candidatus Latescibacterota bacterium]
MNQAFLKFDSIYKSFPGVQALKNISFGVQEGSVHALIGENGAGKSTLLNILSGVHKMDSGAILINGESKQFQNTYEAITAGVAVIYQELHLVPEMSVAENLMLGNLPARYGVINGKKLRQKVLKELSFLGEDINPSAKVGSLPIAQRQMIEIAKALMRDAKIIAFDEPTSSLADREVKKLFSIIRGLKKSGKIIIYVSHRLNEIFDICDSVTVFRDGNVVETCEDIATVDTNYLVSQMVGRSISDIYNYSRRTFGDTALEVAGILGSGLTEPASLTVSKGEIVGIFGLVGSGRSELLKLIYGAEKKHSGTVRIHDKSGQTDNPSSSIDNGLAFIPEDRKKEGIIPLGSVAENINLSARRQSSRFGILNKKWETVNAEKNIEQLDIKTPSPFQTVKHLSGGNQQKVILARWLSGKIKVLLMDEPTRGIDVGVKSEIYSIINQLASEAIGIIVVSSELPEILGISDRIIVMRRGKIVSSLNRAEATEEKVLNLALPVE